MDNEKSILIKEEPTNEMCPEQTTMFLDDPLGVYWSTDHINEDSMPNLPNLGWDENENNNAAVDTLLHTILEAESESCPPPLLVPKKELFPDHTLGISCLTDFIKEDPELNLEADETENIFHQDPLKLEEHSFYVKQEVDLKLDVDDSEQKFLADPLHIEDPDLHIKQDPELDLDVDESEHNFVQNPLGITWATDFIKEVPKQASEMEETKNIAIASRSYPANNTRLLQSNERCDFPVEENVSQGVGNNELEIGSEGSTHFIMFREGEEEEKEEEEDEESLSAPRKKCSSREQKCQTFICSFCLQSFTSKYRLMMHVFVHIDGVQPPKSVCKSCAEVFPSNMSLKKHLKVSEAEQDSSADNAETSHWSGKSFTPLGTLKGQALRDNESRTHKCDICGKYFNRLSNLKIHALIHTRIKPHKCDICVKSFIQSSHLKSHAFIHNRERPHKCDNCGKSFTQVRYLKSHSLIHTGMRPHKCDICGKSFTLVCNLKSHALIHTGTKPHKCDICGKSFTQLSVLKRHELIHTGIRSYKCDICGKSFTHVGNLKTHALIHTGTKPHRCDICCKSFTQSSTLKRHALIHTGTTSQV